MAFKSGVQLRVDRVPEMLAAVAALTGTRVMVGVPDTKAGRKEGPINNAALAYIHDKGSPAARIPARPFMEPGIKSVQDKIKSEFEAAGELALNGNINAVSATFTRVGILAVNAIRAKITAGIPPPLAPSTIKGRIRRVRGKKRREMREAAAVGAKAYKGTPWSVQEGAEGIFTPLIVTGALRNSITWITRKISLRLPTLRRR